jgi:hypothetical protein
MEGFHRRIPFLSAPSFLHAVVYDDNLATVAPKGTFGGIEHRRTVSKLDNTRATDHNKLFSIIRSRNLISECPARYRYLCTTRRRGDTSSLARLRRACTRTLRVYSFHHRVNCTRRWCR